MSPSFALRDVGRLGDFFALVVSAVRNRPRLALFLFAFVVRFAWLSALLGSAEELIEFPAIDGAFYHQWAQDILAGTGLSRRAFVAHPLYPHVLAALYAVAGVEPLVAVVVQCLLGALACVAMVRLASRFFENRIAWLSGVGLALFWPAVANVALLETVELGNFLLILALVLAPSRASPWRSLASGVLLGAATLCRANLLVLAPAFLLPLFEVPGWRARFPRAAAFALGLSLIFLTVGIRNRLVANEWLFLTGHAGLTLYCGFAPDNFSGTYQAPPFVRPEPKFEQADFRAEAERRLGRTLRDSEVSRYWATQALRSISDDPKGAAVRIIKKMGLTLAAYEVADNYNLRYLRSLTPFRFIPLPGWETLLALSVIGCGASWSNRRKHALLCAAVALYSLTLLLFFVSSRLRAPLWILLMPFAAAGATQIWAQFADPRRRSLRQAALALAIGGVSLAIVPSFMKRLELSQAWATHAHALQEAGDLVAAARLQAQAMAVEGRNPYLLVNVGELSSRMGNPHEAIAVCRRAAEIAPRLASAHACSGVGWAQIGQLAKAEFALRRAVALDPTSIGTWVNLAITLGRSGSGEEARWLVQKLVRVAPNDPAVRAVLKALKAAAASNESPGALP